MFEETPNNNNQTPGATPAPEEKVYTMPMDYYIGGKTPNANAGGGGGGGMSGGKKRMIIMIVIIVAAVLVVAGGTYAFYKFYYSAPAAPKTALSAADKTAPKNNTNQAQIDEAKKKADEQAKADALKKQQEEEAKKLADEQAAAAKKFDPSKVRQFALSLVSSPDRDRDGLTDDEEALLGTSVDIIDTDLDTYKDGDEVKNLYSPLDKGKKIVDTNLVKTFANGKYGYEILCPSAWVVSAIDPNDPTEVMITANNGDFIDILVQQKKATETLEDWYLAQVPNATKADIKYYKTSVGKVDVMESKDGFTVFVARENTVYILNYNIGLKEEASYPALFQMLVNSFKMTALNPAWTMPVASPAAIAPTGTGVSTGATGANTNSGATGQ